MGCMRGSRSGTARVVQSGLQDADHPRRRREDDADDLEDGDEGHVGSFGAKRSNALIPAGGVELRSPAIALGLCDAARR